jgi:hypothetical protein
MFDTLPDEVICEYILPQLDRLSVLALASVSGRLWRLCSPLLPAFGQLRASASLECVHYALRHQLSTHSRIFVQLCRAGMTQHLLAVLPQLKLDQDTLEQGLLRAAGLPPPRNAILPFGLKRWWRTTTLPVNVLCHLHHPATAALLAPWLTPDHFQYGDGHVLREAIAKNLPEYFKWCIETHSYGRTMADVEWYVDEVHWPVWQMLRAAIGGPNTAESTLHFYKQIRKNVYVYSRNELFARVQQHFTPIIDMLAAAGRVTVLWWLHRHAQVVTPHDLIGLGHRYRLVRLLELVFWRYPQMRAPSPMQLRLAPAEVRWICAVQRRRLEGFTAIVHSVPHAPPSPPQPQNHNGTTE